MATVVRGPNDDSVRALKTALDAFEQHSAGAEASLYRQNSGSIRVRIIDDRFAGMGRSRRHEEVWNFLARQVSEEAMGEISLLLLLPHAELRASLANLEFEDPTPSTL